MASPLTYQHRSTGPTLVTYNEEPLGYTDDSIKVVEQPVYQDIYTDAFGGSSGVPADTIHLGSIAIVTCRLNRFDYEELRWLGTGNSPVANQPPAIGSFVRLACLWKTLVLSNRSETITYDQSFLRQGRQFNLGTRHQIFTLVFECHIGDPCDRALYTIGNPADPCSS